MNSPFYMMQPGKSRKPQCLVPGLFVHAPFVFLDNPSPLILRIDTDKNPELLEPPPLQPDEALPELTVSVRKNPIDAFSEELPEVKKLGIHKKEELLILKAKQRPGIILSSHAFNQQCETVLVIPIFSLDKAYINEKAKQEIRERLHPLYFYLPESEEFNIKESFADFSQVQSISQKRINPSKKKLSNLALQALYAKQISEHTEAYSYVTKTFQ
ncbi:MAG: type II toxin-antitoxin system PemK/MazF family toxin [Bacillota bacterium]